MRLRDCLRHGFFVLLVVCVCPAAWGQTAQLRDCRTIEDALERVACYDAVVDATRVSSAEESSTAVTVDRPSESGAQPPVRQQEIDPEAIFGRGEESIRETLEIEDVSEIVQRVAEVRRAPLGELIVTLENGQIWAQSGDRKLNLKPGDEVNIRAGIAGSYYLKKTSGSRSLKVRRID